jgi:hypothetical protein
MKQYNYSTDFYKNSHEATKQAAEEIVPLVLELIHPESVIYIGRGVGTWLSVLQNMVLRRFWGLMVIMLIKKCYRSQNKNLYHSI